jgi:hypothetical protein
VVEEQARSRPPSSWWRVLMQTIEPLLADFGCAAPRLQSGELAERLRRKMLRGTPETQRRVRAVPVDRRFDAVDGRLMNPGSINSRVCCPSDLADDDTLRWQHCVMDALAYCTAQATGFARTSPAHGPNLGLRVFHALASDVDALRPYFQHSARSNRPDRAIEAGNEPLQGRSWTPVAKR